MLQRPPEASARGISKHSGTGAAKEGSVAERSNLVLSFARVLQVNGQSTHETLKATGRLSRRLGLDATIIPQWGELQIQATDGSVQLVSLVAANPTGVDMDRVANAMG